MFYFIVSDFTLKKKFAVSQQRNETLCYGNITQSH